MHVTVALWVAFVLAALALDRWTLTQLAQYMAYGIFAMALAFIWGQAGILSFGQAIFFGIGGYSNGENCVVHSLVYPMAFTPTPPLNDKSCAY